MAEHGSAISIYTDGSKSDSGVGYAVAGLPIALQNSLNHRASVYTAELLAIKSALDQIVLLNLKNVVIYTDSRSSLEAVKQFYPTNAIVNDIRLALHNLKKRKVRVTLCWIPSHIGVEGNEKS